MHERGARAIQAGLTLARDSVSCRLLRSLWLHLQITCETNISVSLAPPRKDVSYRTSVTLARFKQASHWRETLSRADYYGASGSIYRISMEPTDFHIISVILTGLRAMNLNFKKVPDTLVKRAAGIDSRAL
jgi:hypothetical protein